jgi:hypothetical protein
MRMHLNLSPKYIVTFLLLVIVMLEVHEIVHITVGRIICGSWGTRDFNVWSLCEGCQEKHPLSWLSTFAGPLFSFMLMWVGLFWLHAVNAKKKALGFALIFSNIPFGRISRAMMGSGDEMVVTQHLFKNSFSNTQLIIICSAVVLVAGLPPIIVAYKVLTNKRKWIYIIGYLTLPIAFILTYVLNVLNSLLNRGFLSAPGVMGTPLLITVHTCIASLLLIILRHNLYNIANNNAN